MDHYFIMAIAVVVLIVVLIVAKTKGGGSGASGDCKVEHCSYFPNHFQALQANPGTIVPEDATPFAATDPWARTGLSPCH